MDIFRYDSDFMQAIGRIADLAWLNILCAICCFPIFTAGAAVTAKYYTAMKLERGQAPGVTKTFFRAFKENFLQDLKVTVILILICAFFAYDWLYIYKQGVGSLSPVVIGEGSWLGENVCVCGAKVGKHCVIGANSVVTTDIPDYCVAVGSPAKVVKRFDFDRSEWVRV